MAIRIEDPEQYQPSPAYSHASLNWVHAAVLGAGSLLLTYLCWRLLAPFLPALCWAFSLALVAQPIYNWLLRRSVPRAVSAAIIIVLVVVVVFGPGVILARALAGEASGIVTNLTTNGGAANIRQTIENNRFAGSVLRWLDTRLDLADEAVQLVRSLAGWASSTVSLFLTGSIWLLGQISVTFFALFYFLRDGEMILANLRSIIPLPASKQDAVFSRVAQTIRLSLGAKILVGSIQGALGGLIFFWLGIPAPVFWGLVMAVLSIFPLIGAFLVWAPVALALALQGEWPHALFLTAWEVLVIHPVDNLLGPVLVGSALRLHTLLIFFAVVGGIGAFGAAGVVLGPVIVAIVVTLFELKQGLIFRAE